jgi:hypothetical protein
VTPYRKVPLDRGTYWVSQPFSAIMSGVMCAGLSAIGLVLVVAGSTPAVWVLVAAAAFAVLCQAGLQRFVIEDGRVLLVAGIVSKRTLKAFPITDGARVRVTHRQRMYRAHIVELTAEQGHSVIAECDDHAEAREIATFVERALG